MKKLFSNYFILVVFISLPSFFSPATLTAQKNKNPVKYQKILILAKVEQANSKKQFEDAMVKALKDKGYNAIPSYSNLTPDDLSNLDKLSAKADTLKIDALLAFSVINVETTIVNTPQVSASVGVPVRVGFMSVCVGGSVPLGGGPKQVKTVNVRAGLYNKKGSQDPVWSLVLSGNLDNGTDELVYKFVKKTVKTLFSQSVL
jgi:hypothetical protein